MRPSTRAHAPTRDSASRSRIAAFTRASALACARSSDVPTAFAARRTGLAAPPAAFDSSSATHLIVSASSRFDTRKASASASFPAHRFVVAASAASAASASSAAARSSCCGSYSCWQATLVLELTQRAARCQ